MNADQEILKAIICEEVGSEGSRSDESIFNILSTLFKLKEITVRRAAPPFSSWTKDIPSHYGWISGEEIDDIGPKKLQSILEILSDSLDANIIFTKKIHESSHPSFDTIENYVIHDQGAITEKKASKPKKASKSKRKPYKGSRRGKTESQAQQMAAGIALRSRRKHGKKGAISRLKGASKSMAAMSMKDLRKLATIRRGSEVPDSTKKGHERAALPGHIKKEVKSELLNMRQLILSELWGKNLPGSKPSEAIVSGEELPELRSLRTAINELDLDSLEKSVEDVTLNLQPDGMISNDAAGRLEIYSGDLGGRYDSEFSSVAASIDAEQREQGTVGEDVRADLSYIEGHGLPATVVDEIKSDVADILVESWVSGIERLVGDIGATSEVETFKRMAMRILMSSLRATIFGIIDNLVLILIADQLNKRMAGRLMIHVPGFGWIVAVGMMHEALGNAVSDVFGETFASPGLELLSDRWTWLKPDHWMSERELAEGPRLMRFLDLMSNIVGVFVGCMIGALVLFFMDAYKKAAKKAVESAMVVGASRALGLTLSTLAWALILGAFAHVGIRMWGASIYDKAKQDNTFKAVQGAWKLVLRLSGVVSGGMRGEEMTVDPELEPYFDEIERTDGAPDTVQNPEMWALLRQKIDRDIYDQYFSAEQVRTWAAGEIKPGLARDLVGGLSQKLGYVGSSGQLDESRWLKIAGIIK